VPASELRTALAGLLGNHARRREMSAAARAYALTQRFSDRAADLGRLLLAD
jgi:hypothetical protein